MTTTTTEITTTEKRVKFWEATNAPLMKLCFSGPDDKSTGDHLVAVSTWLHENPDWFLESLECHYDSGMDYTEALVCGPVSFPEDWEPTPEKEFIVVKGEMQWSAA